MVESLYLHRLQAVVSGTDVGITRQLLPQLGGTSELREAREFFEAGVWFRRTVDVETGDAMLMLVYASFSLDFASLCEFMCVRILRP